MMDFNSILSAITITSMILIFYHHFLYPALMAYLGRKKASEESRQIIEGQQQPYVTVVMPAYNEAQYIEEKIGNLARLDYPASQLEILVICDGCSDDTAARAAKAAHSFPETPIRILSFPDNRGKVAVLNQVMPLVQDGICVFTDVSALLPADALKRMAAHFDDPRIGAVGASYSIRQADGKSGESFYWRYQTAIKRGESLIGGLVGAHGACYAIRRALFEPLASDTINDDFIIPMRIGLNGHKTVYEPAVIASELEEASDQQDFRRRMRIGAGNLQQALRLLPLLRLKEAGLGFAFLSSKVLRLFMIPALLATFVGSLLLAGESIFFSLAAAGQVLLYLAVAISALSKDRPKSRLLEKAQYFVLGHIASFIGAYFYLTAPAAASWKGYVPAFSADYLSTGTAGAKRLLDIVGALLALSVSAVFFPIIALAIKLESPGPVFFKQLRVGRVLDDRTELFEMIKFRSMRQDAEAGSGPVWASENDPRITKIGLFLRKTRLDELPQFINVLRGEMSIVGPRPERPGFYKNLETAIPFYSERTFGIRPGITGLAQVNQGYDRDIEDVRRKVMFDHAYAAAISRFWSWLKMDFSIFGRTVLVMALGRGQ